MMKISAIVAEYNPFHNGHLYQLEKTKELTECDYVIAVMSGNFAQRGIPCCVDKYTRTKMALTSGIDLVIELPMPFATASAERFCEGAVSILTKTNLVNTISFGSESGKLDLLIDTAKLLLDEPPSISESIQTSLREGISFPRARATALANYLHRDPKYGYTNAEIMDTLNTPNNILGIHYIKALLKYDSPITPLTIKRKIAAYHDDTLSSHIASATAIRKHLTLQNMAIIGQSMPSNTHSLLQANLEKNNFIPTLDSYSQLLQYKLSFSDTKQLYTLWDIPKDLLSSIINVSKNNYNISDIIQAVCSKTYTKATVQRALLRILLDVDSLTMNALNAVNWIPYIRVLGCKKSATKLLSELTKSSSVPIITNLGRNYSNLNSLSKKLIDFELAATKLYYLAGQSPWLANQDLTAPFIVL